MRVGNNVSLFVQYLVSFLAGALFARSAYDMFIGGTPRASGQVVWLIGAFVVCTVAAAFTLRFVIAPRAARLSRARHLLLAGVALIGGVGLAWAFRPAAMHTLEIVATGERAVAARGSEVWLLEATVDGRSIPFDAFVRDEGWDVRDEALLFVAGELATLTWRGEARSGVRLRLLAHPWSGIVAVRWNGMEQMLDLYSAGGTERVVDLPAQSQCYTLLLAVASTR